MSIVPSALWFLVLSYRGLHPRLWSGQPFGFSFQAPGRQVRSVNNLDKKPPRRPACVENSEPSPLVLANERVLGMFTQKPTYQCVTPNSRSFPSSLIVLKGAMLCARRCRSHSTASPLTINDTLVHAQRHRRQAHFQVAWWVDGEIGASLGGARMWKIGSPSAPLALQIENFQLPVFSLKNQDKSPLAGDSCFSHPIDRRGRQPVRRHTSSPCNGACRVATSIYPVAWHQMLAGHRRLGRNNPKG